MDRDRYGGALAVVTATSSSGPSDTALERFLGSLPAAAARPVPVVVVACGAPGPEAGPVTLGGDPGHDPGDVRVLRIGEDVGFAAAVNRGVAALDADVGWLAVASPHVEWGGGTLDALRSAADRWPRAGALGPVLRGPSGVIRAGAVPPVGGALGVALTRVLPDGPPVKGPGEGPVGWLPSACLLLRRAAFDSVDGFDPRYRDHLADADLGDRLARAGWLSVRVPTAQAAVPAPPHDPAELRSAAVRYLNDRVPGPLRPVLRAFLGR
ncbi:MAG TPA: glycosyltransferase family 2 protein [Pseudonocardia sp.]|nr:glycosyltransferase family 2 protein [Pseudonocardia sp.]